MSAESAQPGRERHGEVPDSDHCVRNHRARPCARLARRAWQPSGDRRMCRHPSRRPPRIDVCSWHRQHAEMTIAAAARKPKAIICQKPMALSLGEADDMLTACERNDVDLYIAFQRPHHATWARARQLIADGAIGKVLQVSIDDGGNILNTNSHNIRLALHLLGEETPRWVMGAVERTTDVMERGLPCEDRCMGLVGFDSGATLLIQGELVGSRGTIGDPRRR
ncbi:MAG: gfo/Idh/MocA family oxidoreductase, partial [Proteobacteria bacterium]|nr:gfo/Idh/MocA family oxidoreductase [Pseudomonadota bacterium]